MFNILQPLIDLAYPDLCIICRQEVKISRNLFCMRCLTGLPFTGFESGHQEDFKVHFEPEIPLQFGGALFHLHPGSGIARMIHQLKYHNKPFLGLRLGEFMGDILVQGQMDGVFDAIIPVPLHRKKLHQRGYNQSERIAAGLSKKLSVPVDQQVILRNRFTVTQTRLNRMERLKNTRGAFTVNAEYLEKYDHLLLIDDVLTTGATLSGCANALLEVRDVKISMMTIALGN
jgi:ComF family protein